MSSFPKICLVDTNVPKKANLGVTANIPHELDDCVEACIDAVGHIVQNGGLVLDEGGEIFAEYHGQLSLVGEPGLGDRFLKWVHDHQWLTLYVTRVVVTKNVDSYDEFPAHPGLDQFDRSDRKFVAVANAHPDKPPILQATDSKWWGWQDALREAGITVQFLCPEYAESKYLKKTRK